MIKNILFSIFLLLSLATIALGNGTTDIYIAQNSAGGDTGVNCDNAHSAEWFNTAGSWGGGTTDIDPGDTVHLCGTITSPLTAQSSGTSGNIITVYFETGANILHPTFCPGTGCINVENKAWITVDGGTECGYVDQTDTACNGKIYNTTAIPGASSFAITASGCDNCEFKNLEIGPIIITDGDDQGTGDFRGIQNLGGTATDSYFKVHNNKIHNVSSAIVYVPSGSNDNGFEVYNNWTYNINSSVDISNNNGGDLTKALIHDNHFGSTASWDASGCPQHHNSLHSFAKTTTNSGIDYYNNFVDGSWGECSTSLLFIEGGEYGNQYNIRVWNNAFVGTYSVMNNGIVSMSGNSGLEFYNNTIIGSKQAGDVCFNGLGSDGDADIKFMNNILVGCNTTISIEDFTITAWDHNAYENYGTWYVATGNWYSWAQWTGLGYDANSIEDSGTGYILYNADGSLQESSPARGIGSNLSGLGIFYDDILGTTRSAWDLGAYEYDEGGTTTTITGLEIR